MAGFRGPTGAVRDVLSEQVVVHCNEAKVEIQNLAGSLAKKSGKTFCETTNVMQSRMSIAIKRISHIYAPENHASPRAE